MRKLVQIQPSVQLMITGMLYLAIDLPRIPKEKVIIKTLNVL